MRRFPGGNPEPVNITLVITNSSPDFTKLGSFGTAEDFGTNLVNSMDRSYLKRAPKWARRDVKDEDIQVRGIVKAPRAVHTRYTPRRTPLLSCVLKLGINRWRPSREQTAMSMPPCMSHFGFAVYYCC